ncbi:TPA: peptide chain release factor N(5)-glutamine methyltransferase [bacterium]|nr:peptide chain release factor N(5)-glutamine methyltransferase [bacterium]
MYKINSNNYTELADKTVNSLLDWGTNYLTKGNIEDAALNAELLLGHLLNYSRSDIRINYKRRLNTNLIIKYKSLIYRRIKNEPLQYIQGGTEFMGLWLKVDKRVFIPRPETELLVEKVLEICNNKKDKKYYLLDIGTGSGNIPVAVAHKCSNVLIDAVDIDKNALKVAEENIKRYRLSKRIKCIHQDIFNYNNKILLEKYDIIVSNPPYIPYVEYLDLAPEIRKYEPAKACTDCADGLTFYSKIIDLSKFILKEGGTCLVEIGYGQSKKVSDIFSEGGLKNIKIYKDLNKHDRIVSGIK